MHLTTPILTSTYQDIITVINHLRIFVLPDSIAGRLFGKAIDYLADFKMWLNHAAIEYWAFAFTSISSEIPASPFRFTEALVQETKPVFEARIGRKMTLEETDSMLSDLVDFYQVLFEIESKSKSPELVTGETKIEGAA